MGFCREHKGAISIFLILIMIPMFTFAGTIVDMSRMSTAKVAISGASDLAMNAGLSDYNKVLKDVYGLFAMSSDEDELKNNLERYFSNSIDNAGILEASDSYTRNYLNSLSGWFTDSGAAAEADFDNLLDIQSATFDPSYVDNSQLSETSVLRRQMLEYMKYRAPVSMTTTLIGKLTGFKDFSKQSAVLKKKVTYEKEMEGMSSYCQTAWEQLNKFKDEYYGTGTKLDGLINEIESAVENSDKNYKQISELLVGIKTLEDNKCTEYSSYSNADPSYYEYLEEQFDSAVEELEQAEENNESSQDSSESADSSDSSSEAEEEIDEFDKFMYGFECLIPDLKSLFSIASYEKDGDKLIINIDKNTDPFLYATELKAEYEKLKADDYSLDNIKKVIAFAKKINKWNSENSEMRDRIFTSLYFLDEKVKEMKLQDRVSDVLSNELIDCMNTIYLVLVTTPADTNGYIQIWSNKVNQLANDTYSSLNAVYKKVKKQIDQLEICKTALDKVVKQIESVEKAGDKWQETIDDIDDTNAKSAMQSDYDSSADMMNKADAERLRDNVIAKDLTYFEELKSNLESITYCGKKLCSNSQDDYVKAYKNAKKASDGNISSTAESVHTEQYKTWTLPAYPKTGYIALKNISDIDMTDKGDDNDDQRFYGYLKQVCNTEPPAKPEEGESEIKEEANKKALIEEGKLDNVTGGEMPKFDSADKLSSEIYNKIIDDVTSGKGLDNYEPADVGEGNDNDETAEKATDISDGMTGYLDSLGNLSELMKEGRDKLYLTEYMTEMFSTYTSGKGMNTDPKTLSNVAITPGNNVLYQAECEYILWGQKDISNNITYTKLLIFGLRFTLNSIYAFTAADIQAMAFKWAVAIAGWTGFGVPIVQTVITLALALAESVNDVRLLSNGEAVPIYKSATTWVFSPSGLTKYAVEEAGEKLSEAAQSAASDIFGKINKLATDGIDKATDIVEDYTEETLETLKSQITSFAIVPIRNTIEGLYSKIDKAWSKEKIKSELDKIVSSMESQIDKGDESVLNRAKIEAINYLKTQTGSISDTLYEKIAIDVPDLQGAVDEIEICLSTIIDEIQYKAETLIKSANEKLKKEVNEITKKGEDNAKDLINKTVNEYVGNISGKLPDDKSVSKIDMSGKNGNSASSALTMTYDEYLYAFMLIAIMGNEDMMIARTGQLIQLNISSGMKDCGKNESGFDLTKSYTMIMVQSSIEVEATFMGIFTPHSSTDGSGKTTYTVDFDADGKTTNTVSYTGTIGY